MKQNKLFALFLLMFCVLAISACSSRSAMYSSVSWPGISSDGSVIYTANGTTIDAIQDGKKLWSYPESGNNRVNYYASPAVDDTHVYAGTYSNRLHVINKADGTLAADIEIGNNKNKVIASPLLAEGNVIVVSSGGMVSSYPAEFSAETVKPNWQTTLTNELWVKPVYADGVIYVPSLDKKINLVNAETGAVEKSIDISGAIMNDPVLGEGKIYFSTLAKEVDEMDLASGEIRKLLTTEGEIWASPLLLGDKLVAADMSGYVYCVDINTAEPVWTTEKVTAEKIGFIASPVALDEETILLVDENGETMTYDLSGKSIGQRTQNQIVYSTPVVLESGSFAVIPAETGDTQVKTYTRDLKEDWIYSSSAKAESTAESGEGK